MLVRRYIVSILALAGLAAAGSLVVASAKAKIPVKPESAEEIAKAWRYNPEAKAYSWQGGGPKDSDKLYVDTGRLTGATFEGAWNFYAQKCGSDKKYAEPTFNSVSDQTKDGVYVILDGKRDDLRTTSFAFTNQRTAVSVQLRQASDKDKIYMAITVATR